MKIGIIGAGNIGSAAATRLLRRRSPRCTYVDPGHRDRGLGTALTRRAIEAAGDVEDLWICADDEDRAKTVYAGLGFEPAWTTMEFTRFPGADAPPAAAPSPPGPRS